MCDSFVCIIDMQRNVLLCFFDEKLNHIIQKEEYSP